MNLQTWMSNPQLLKLRDKLKDWSRDDLLRYVLNEFGKTELTKAELGKVIAHLRKPHPTKAPREIEFVLPEKTPECEFIWLSNKKSLVDETRWVLSEGCADLRFGSSQEVTAWAYHLIVNDTNRRTWKQLIDEWRAWCRVDRFKHGIYPAPVSVDLGKYLKQLTARISKNTTVLPDNATIRKRYWSLEVGEVVSSKDKKYMIKRIRPMTEAPPVVELEETDG